MLSKWAGICVFGQAQKKTKQNMLCLAKTNAVCHQELQSTQRYQLQLYTQVGEVKCKRIIPEVIQASNKQEIKLTSKVYESHWWGERETAKIHL